MVSCKAGYAGKKFVFSQPSEIMSVSRVFMRRSHEIIRRGQWLHIPSHSGQYQCLCSAFRCSEEKNAVTGNIDVGVFNWVTSMCMHLRVECFERWCLHGKVLHWTGSDSSRVTSLSRRSLGSISVNKAPQTRQRLPEGGIVECEPHQSQPHYPLQMKENPVAASVSLLAHHRTFTLFQNSVDSKCLQHSNTPLWNHG